MGKNRMNTISKFEYLEAGQLFHWGDSSHYVRWFVGDVGRHKRTEVMLPRLVRKGKLISRRFERRLVYTVPRRKNDRNIAHGLGCTEGLVRFWRSDREGLIVPERHLRGSGIVPEFGIRYKTRQMLLYEFCTADNFYRPGNMKGKITRYRHSLHMIEEKFDASAVVVFVCVAPRWDVDKFVYQHLPVGDPFFFTDYQTFNQCVLGMQLTTPIYLWGEDGQPYALRTEHV